MVEDGRYADFAPRPNDWIQAIILITHDNLRVMDHGHLEVGALEIQIVNWKQCQDNFPMLTNCMKHTNFFLKDI